MSRVWDRIDIRGPDECWPWMGARHPDGYGHMRFAGRTRPAHRVVSEMVDGPIPPGVKVRHSCDNPPCCNPAHLLRGTQADNVRDRHVRGRDARQRGEANGRAKLTEADVREIRAAYARGGVTHRELGDRYGVSDRHVGHLLSGRRWGHS